MKVMVISDIFVPYLVRIGSIGVVKGSTRLDSGFVNVMFRASDFKVKIYNKELSQSIHRESLVPVPEMSNLLRVMYEHD